MVFPFFDNFTKKVTPGKLVGADKTDFFEVVMNTNIKKVDLDYTVQPGYFQDGFPYHAEDNNMIFKD